MGVVTCNAQMDVEFPDHVRHSTAIIRAYVYFYLRTSWHIGQRGRCRIGHGRPPGAHLSSFGLRHLRFRRPMCLERIRTVQIASQRGGLRPGRSGARMRTGL